MDIYMQPMFLTGVPKVIVACILGLLLGFVLVNSKLAHRKTLIDQLSFENNNFAITFLFSIVVGVPIYFFLTQYGLINLSLTNYHFWPILAGAIIVGLGIAMCGHIPITAVASLGAGKIYTLITLAGMLMAFPLVSFFKPTIKQYIYSKEAPANINFIAKDTILYDGKSTMLYVLPIICLILALFLRLIHAKNSK